MKLTVEKCIIIGIVLLYHYVWISVAQETLTDSNILKGAMINSSIRDKLMIQQNGSDLQSSNYFLTSSSSSHIPSILSTIVNIASLLSTQSFFFPGTAIPVIADPENLLKNSIQELFSNASSIRPHSFSTPNVIAVPTSYLSTSSYLLNSYYLLENSSGHVSAAGKMQLTSSYAAKSVSSLHESYEFIESDYNSGHYMFATESISPTSSAENRILPMTSGYAVPLSVELISHDKNNLYTSIPVIESSKTEVISSIELFSSIENYDISSSLKEENQQVKNTNQTVLLHEELRTNFSDFFIETSTIFASNETKVKETNNYSVFQSQAVSSSLEFNVDDVSSVSRSIMDKLPDKGYDHEIISDDSSEKNKTLRNEDGEIDEILSGIIHLLAGNVHVVRPPNNGYGIKPTRLHLPLQPTLVSTRINNRGPIRPNNLSRTVVVFSQPHNKGQLPELALPGHIVPSTVQNPQFIMIRPTKVVDRRPPATSLINFYKQRPKPSTPHLPFRGEIFNANRPVNNPVKVTNLPDEFLMPSFTDNRKQQHTFNSNLPSKYPHFVFSEAAESSAVIFLPSKAPNVETFDSIPPNTLKSENTDNINIPSKNFEVLMDDSLKNNIRGTPSLKFPDNFNVGKISKYGTEHSEIRISGTRSKHSSIPHGPITDWVLHYESPSSNIIKYNESHVATSSINVPNILNSKIFDAIVNSSINEIQKTRMPESNQNYSYLPVTPLILQTVTSQSSFQEIPIVEPTKVIHSPESILIKNSSKIPDVKLSLDNSSILSNESTQVTDLKEKSTSTESTTSREFSTSRKTTRSTRGTSTSVRPSTQMPPPRFPYNNGVGSFYPEKRPLAENTNYVDSTLKNISHLFSLDDKSHSTTSIPKIYELKPLGRPIVIPIDIEDVRPFVGGINPPNKDTPWEDPYEDIQSSQGSSTKDAPHRISHVTTSRTPILRKPGRPNTVRIDTCIVGDDSTCNTDHNETCKTEIGISSCHCRPGFARSYTRGPCIPIVSLMLAIIIDRYENNRIVFSSRYLDKNSQEYRLMEYESQVGLTTLISTMPAFSRTFLGIRINRFFHMGLKLVVNSTILLEERESTRTQAIRLRLRQLIWEALRQRNLNLGDSHLYVEGSYNPVASVEDLNECSEHSLNDCSQDGTCFNVFGTFLCKCNAGQMDPFLHDERKRGRQCSVCTPEYCSFHGKCVLEKEKPVCKCHGNYIGYRCEIDGEVLGVALGASAVAIIIILITLGCLCIWNHKWKQDQQKAEEVMSSQSYSSNQAVNYMSSRINGSTNLFRPTIEDRMRWAHISDILENISVPNSELPYMPSHDQRQFPSRCQIPSDENAPWYENRSRPRSQARGEYGGVPGPTCFEMDTLNRRHYLEANYGMKRNKHASLRY